MSEFNIKIDKSIAIYKEIEKNNRTLLHYNDQLGSIYDELCVTGLSYVDIRRLDVERNNLNTYIDKMKSFHFSYGRIIKRYIEAEKRITVDNYNRSTSNAIYDTKSETDKKGNAVKLSEADKKLIESIKEALSWKYEYSFWRWLFHPDQRRNMISEIITKLAEIYGVEINAIEISSEENPVDGYITYGWYSNGKIWINEKVLSLFGYDEMIHTILHELRHAYQDKIAKGEYEGYDEETLKQWRDVFINGEYKSGKKDDGTVDEESFNQYDNQPIETDADYFADQIQEQDGNL